MDDLISNNWLQDKPGLPLFVFECTGHDYSDVMVWSYWTCSGGGLWELLLVDVQVQGSLTQLLQVTRGRPAEALQRQTHVLLSDEQSLHYTFGSVQQVCEGNLDRRRVEEKGWQKHRVKNNSAINNSSLKTTSASPSSVTYPTFLLSRNSDSLVLSLWDLLSLLQVRTLALLLHISNDRSTNTWLFYCLLW